MNTLTHLRRLKEHLQTRRGKLVVVGIHTAFYLAIFIALRPRLDWPITMLGILPILVGAWLYGMWAGILLTVVIYLITILTTILLGWEDIHSIYHIAGLLGLAISAVVSLIVGRLGEMSRRNRDEFQRNTSLLEERRAQARFLTLLNDILRDAMETDDTASMLKVLAEHTGELFGTEKCYITLWDEKHHKTTRLEASGMLSEVYTSIHRSIPNEHSITAAILEAGRPLAIEDLRQAPFLDPEAAEKYPHRSALGLPLIAGNRKLGAVILGFSEQRSFTQDDLARGELAARQISLAITKALLLEEMLSRLHELAGLHAISQAFSLHGNPRRTFRLLNETLAKLLGARVCVIALYDPMTGELRARAPAHGLEEDALATLHYSLENSDNTWDFSKKEPLCANSREDIPAEFQPWAHLCGFKSLLIAPLWDKEKQRIGAIFAANKPGGFGENELHLVEKITGQVVNVIQNTRLLSDERRRAEQISALHAITVAATEASHEDQLIDRVTHLIGERLYPDSFGVLLLDETVGELYLHSSYRVGAHEGPMRIPLGIGIAGIVAKRGQPRRVDDVSITSEHLSLYPLTHSQLCVPLKVEETLIGVVNAESTRSHAFTQEDEELLTIIAGQLATAIQRLRAARAEQYQTEQLARSNSMIQALAQVNARAASATDPDSVMQTLGFELARLKLNCLIALSDAAFEQAVIRYVSLPERVLQALERVSKENIRNYGFEINRIFPYSDPNVGACLITDPPGLMRNLIPGFATRSAKKILKLIGIADQTTICHLPLINEGKPVGILWMWGDGLQESDLPTMSLFARQVAGVLQNAELLAEVRRLASTDDLTGLFNRRHFFELARKEFARAQRGKHPLSAMIVDLDRFKHFNDSYGHAVGDQVLVNVARLLQMALRESDILGRYGGEEFSILLPDTEARAAVQVAKRLIAQVSGARIETEAGPMSVQMSIGVAEMSDETPTLHLLVSHADQAMYIAKAAGHNRVTVK